MLKSKFWKNVQNSLITYDAVLKETNIEFVLCDHFLEGVFQPKDQKIILCANTLVRKDDFENALKRMLIKMYDYNRAVNTYNPDNCKHLACTEVRAALFSSRCNPKERSRLTMFKGSSKAKEKLVANDFCIKDLATEHLKEKSKCAEKADRYVDYVFERCKLDTAPLKSNSKASKLKSFTDIM
jgi:hypothetical protein